MTILVTGGAGYIGGHMTLALARAKEPVVVIDNMYNGVPWAIPNGVPFVLGDVGDYETVTRVIREHRVSAIIHFAATLIMPEHYRRPLEYYRINSAGSRGLLQAASDCGIDKFIFSATSAVYGNPVSNPVSEQAVIAPVSPYGKSKWATECMLRDLSEVTDFNYVALRYFNVAGADPEGAYGQSTTKTTLLVQIAVQSALGIRDGIEIFGDDYPTPDGTCIRDYLHVTDLIDAHMAALAHLREGRGNLTCNVGYGHGYSVKDIIDTVKRVSGKDFPVRVGPRRLGDAIAVVAEAQRVREVLGWTPKYDNIETIVTHALRWEERLQRIRNAWRLSQEA
jgi:UDP-glucose 4-epimerase